MALQIKGKFIVDDAVDGDKILLKSGQSLKIKKADNSIVDIVKLDEATGRVLGGPSNDALAKKSEVDAIETGAGLSSEGAYVADSSTEYLDNATSLADADKKLDAAIKAIWDARNANNGFAGLDGNGKVPSSQLPKIALTSVTVVASIAARDALSDQEEGDVVKVTDAGNGLPKTYIKTTTGWIEVESGSDVDTVNGYTGTVVLDAADIKMDGSAVTVETRIGNLVSLSGVAADSASLGSFTGSTIADSRTVKAALQDLETAHESALDKVDDLVTLSGVAANAENLGSFTGSTIADSRTVKDALQDLETAHEDHLNDSVDAHDASAISVVAVNGNVTVQAVLEDHENRVDEIAGR
jgi:enamine deaminase RidA (YjgF/YER057c/UK114 family)